MGAWFSVRAILQNMLDETKIKNSKLFYAGIKESASTATGLFKRHEIEQNEIINSIFTEV